MDDPPGAALKASKALKNTSLVGGWTALSRVLGLVRDIAFARAFGASPVMDAFFVAFKIPNLLRRFFAEGAFAQAFVPVLSEYRSLEGDDPTRQLMAAVSGALGAVLLAVTIVGVVAAPWIILVFAPGFQGDGRADLATEMLRFTFPYLFFISLTGLAGGVLNTYGRFGVPAFTPALLNVVLITFVLWIAPQAESPGVALAIGVFVAGAVQLAFQLPFLAHIKMLPRPRWGFAHEGVRRIGRLMLPILFGSSVAQINILFDTLIASLLAAGSISWLYYSDRLMEFPLGVFGIALATVILPGLSGHHARGESAAFSAVLDWALRLTLIIGLPAALGLVVLARPLLATIFLGGAFTPADLTMAAASLVAYGAGLLGFILVKVLAPGYFARQDPRTPVRVGIIAVVANMFLNVLFVVVLVVTDWFPAHAGLAAATTCSAFLNAYLLGRGLRKRGIYRPGPGWGRLVARVAVAAAIMVAALLGVKAYFGDWTVLAFWHRIGGLAVLVSAGAAVYFAALAAFGLRPRQFVEP